jgi:hypothetical protein
VLHRRAIIHFRNTSHPLSDNHGTR